VITVLRLNHRAARDKRITTHCALVSRAFGADEMVYTGERDQSLEKSVAGVAANWGGSFRIRHERAWKPELKRKATRVHLTMYGERLKEVVPRIPRAGDIVIVIGGEKVPWEIYQECDYNVGVGNQPHSEVSSLAVFLHEYFDGKELDREFGGAKLRVKPSPRGKNVEKLGNL